MHCTNVSRIVSVILSKFSYCHLRSVRTWISKRLRIARARDVRVCGGEGKASGLDSLHMNPIESLTHSWKWLVGIFGVSFNGIVLLFSLGQFRTVCCCCWWRWRWRRRRRWIVVVLLIDCFFYKSIVFVQHFGSITKSSLPTSKNANTIELILKKIS